MKLKDTTTIGWLSAEEDQLLGAGDGDSRPLYRFKERADQLAVVDGPRELLPRIDSDGGDAQFSEADGDLIADSGGGFGIPVELGARETVQLGSVFFDEFLLGGRGDGNDGVGGGATHLRGDFPAGQNQAEEVG